MKRFFLVTILFLSLAGFGFRAAALPKDSVPAVEMMGYEQGRYDSRATLSLKNNTSEEIRDVTFLIEYLDMQDVPMDYEVFTEQVRIAPGMTKKIDIPAYESERNYVYYKSRGSRISTPYKIRYEFKGYNTLKPVDARLHDRQDRRMAIGSSPYFGGRDSDGSSAAVIGVIIILMFFAAYIGMFIVVAKMAQKRHRSAPLWLLLSFIGTPFLICIILAALGDDTGRFNRFS